MVIPHVQRVRRICTLDVNNRLYGYYRWLQIHQGDFENQVLSRTAFQQFAGKEQWIEVNQ